MSPEWLSYAACSGADPNVFFPERGESADEALAFCQQCDVRFECLALALAEERLRTPVGIFGGVRASERLAAKRDPDARFDLMLASI